MELSVREAKARFSEAAEAALRGERVVVTRHGAPFVELVRPQTSGGFDFARAHRVSAEMGLTGQSAEDLWPPEFDDPAFSRKVLGLE
ncbi:type II toxin-antitoxin system prevent-host-death family antitoxin [uncultured Sphingomonas sp.]|uniref:type II toxin-antitoxin system Phd/YefM family antitoxin n=1 Tax=uncultured Sphingomonas sp. TaxID=158754 RepID=UPI0025F0BFD5|nr:type II toxin-antitoxin system prevent-host-death family antitoxin [uncultured Sphingomonas sp.]